MSATKFMAYLQVRKYRRDLEAAIKSRGFNCLVLWTGSLRGSHKSAEEEAHVSNKRRRLTAALRALSM